MDIKNYIKVTPKGDTSSHVVLAANKAFYAKHGAKIEEPTEDEVLNAFPELKGTYPGPYQPSKKEIEEVVNQIKEKDEQILSLIAGREADADRIATLKNEIDKALDHNIDKTESENEVIIILQAQNKALADLNLNQTSQIAKLTETIEKLKAKK